MDSKNISFNDMPKMIAVMYDKLNELGDKVDRLMPTEKSEEPQWMNVAALIEYLPNHPAEQTVYGWTSARKIPFHKRGKSILFNPNRSLEKASCNFLMTAIRKTALYMLDS